MSSSKNNPHGLVTGQTLYYVPYDWNSTDRAGEVVVTSVGRKWAGIGSGGRRIALPTMRVYGGGFAALGYCYVASPGSAWRGLRAAITAAHMPPDGVTVERIKQAAELLGLSWGE